jgi:hypothetical protein
MKRGLTVNREYALIVKWLVAFLIIFLLIMMLVFSFILK